LVESAHQDGRVLACIVYCWDHRPNVSAVCAGYCRDSAHQWY
jgi:hypothetical protein